MSVIFNPSSKLSPHFTHREVARSNTAMRQGIDNTPPSEVLQNAEQLARHVLEPIRVHFGIPFSPNSWYRSEKLEKFICWRSFKKWCKRKGYKDHKDPIAWDDYFSRKSHPNGQAADIEIASIDNDQLYDWIESNLQYDQLIREFPKKGDPMSGWVHVSWNSTQANRNQAFSG